MGYLEEKQRQLDLRYLRMRAYGPKTPTASGARSAH